MSISIGGQVNAGIISGPTDTSPVIYIVDRLEVPGPLGGPAFGHGTLWIGGTAVPVSTMGTGWTLPVQTGVGYSEMSYGSVQASSTFSTTVQPASAPASTDCFCTTEPLTCFIAAGTININFAVLMTTPNSVPATSNLRIRVWASTSRSGTNARELTTSTLVTTSFTESTATQQNLTSTWNNPNIWLANEFLFIEVACQVQAGFTNSHGGTVKLVQDGTNSVFKFFGNCQVQWAWPSQDHTVCFFVNRGTGGGGPTRWCWYQFNAGSLANTVNNGGLGLEIYTDSSNNINMLFSGTNNATGSANGDAVAGKWMFVAMAVKQPTAHLYWKSVPNGGLMHITSGGIQPFSGVGVSLCSEQAGLNSTTVQHNGDLLMAGLKMWSGFLSPTEIELESRQIEPVRRFDLIAYLPLHSTGSFQNHAQGSTRQLNWTSFGTTNAVSDAADPPVPIYVPDYSKWK